jgi:hypothetical protein
VTGAESARRPRPKAAAQALGEAVEPWVLMSQLEEQSLPEPKNEQLQEKEQEAICRRMA